MCRWLAWAGEEIPLETLITEPVNSLIDQSLQSSKAKVGTHGDGFGIGWYGHLPEPGLFRETLPAWNNSNLRSLARHIRSELFFAHVRASTGTPTSRENCHPFTVGKWLFMHNGQIADYEKIRRPLEQLPPEDIYAQHRLGTTDSEILFLSLFAHDLDSNPVDAMRRSLDDVHNIIYQAGISDAFRATMTLSDGENIHVLRHSTDDFSPSLYWREDHGNVTIVSEPLEPDPAGWNALPTGHIMTTARNRDPVIQTL